MFYGRSEVLWLALAMSPQVIMTVLSAVPAALLRNEMKFKQAGLAQLVAELSAFAVGVSLAMAASGAFALVASYLVSSAVALAGSWLLSDMSPPWMPRAMPGSWRGASRYGVSIVAGSALWLVALQADNVVVGRLLGTTDLGRYALAFNFGMLPGTVIGSIIGHVAFPVFSMAKLDASRLRREFDSLTYLGATAILPAVAVAVAVAPPAVAWLLGPRWQPAVVPLQVFLLVGAVRGLFPSAELLRSLGRVRVEPVLAAVTAPLVVTVSIMAAGRGIQAVAIAIAAVLLMNEMTVAGIATRSAQIDWIRILRPFKAAVPAICLGLAVWLVSTLIPFGTGYRTVTAITVGCGLYVLLVLFKWLPGHEDLTAVLRLGQDRTG
jgi:PST family polysaccharide transporter